MEKRKCVLTVEIDGHIYEFSCLLGSPRSGAIEATCQFNAFLLGKQAQANAAEQKPEAIKPDEIEG